MAFQRDAMTPSIDNPSEGLLNLLPLFRDACAALERKSAVEVPSLPATVSMMQRDVTNHYRYALSHYFDLSLEEHFLQHSSFGSPYAKWAKFTNDDFEALTFSAHNLIRYTGRLLLMTELKLLASDGQLDEMKDRSNAYVHPLLEIRYQQKRIGLTIQPDHVVSLTPFGPSLENRRFEIRNRAVLAELKSSGLLELDTLLTEATQFEKLCREFYGTDKVAADFTSTHPSWLF